MQPPSLRISTPGRICLFGEHQDYLGLPVIAAAISRRMTIRGSKRSDAQMELKLPDVGSEVAFRLGGNFRIPRTTITSGAASMCFKGTGIVFPTGTIA